ncbi:hypothetical protein EHZ47_00225 [Aeromonas jandaei]|uniref:hypothetical protein n=1 Tax=Aeromonas jandaei TaxID=650 RepID=UPI000F52F8FD|nr:hypothetical protein [Aeromonas jandaei]RQM78573.1 hypothetical protein EHZ47_00225 [Aeromonas jandaei]
MFVGKAVLRWLGISVVFLGYYFWVAVAVFSYSHIDEKESVVLSDTVTTAYHRAILQSVYEANNTVLEAVFYGFPVSVILILLIFKYVR